MPRTNQTGNSVSFTVSIPTLTTLLVFRNTLIQETLAKCDHLYSVDNILGTLCVWNTDHAFKTFSCLKSVFNDLQEEDDSS